MRHRQEIKERVEWKRKYVEVDGTKNEATDG